MRVSAKLETKEFRLSVCVKNMSGEALMPTTKRQARLLLNQGKARIDSYRPFAIQLTYATGEAKQDLVLGIDAGYGNIGFSVVSSQKEFLAGEIKLLEGQVEWNKERFMYRRQRRARLRYRKLRFDNRKKPEGWLAPSIQHKFDSHIKIVNRLKSVLPITKTIVEVATFDIQKIKHPEINGRAYQEGEQLGFWNLRESILHRDNHQCQNPNCQNKAKSPALEVHHIGYWKEDRADRPENLITLCDKCHTPANHKKNRLLHGWEPIVKSFKPETFMSIIRWKIINELKCNHTYGYITKFKRVALKLQKSHYNDAFCIAGGQDQKRAEPVFLQQKRKNNRSLEKFYDAKIIDIRTGKKVSGGELYCGRRKRNKNLDGENLRKYRGPKISIGRRQIRRKRHAIRPHDIVQFI